jgi:hypothetical protein
MGMKLSAGLGLALLVVTGAFTKSKDVRENNRVSKPKPKRNNREPKANGCPS